MILAVTVSKLQMYQLKHIELQKIKETLCIYIRNIRNQTYYEHSHEEHKFN